MGCCSPGLDRGHLGMPSKGAGTEEPLRHCAGKGPGGGLRGGTPGRGRAVTAVGKTEKGQEPVTPGPRASSPPTTHRPRASIPSL